MRMVRSGDLDSRTIGMPAALARSSPTTLTRSWRRRRRDEDRAAREIVEHLFRALTDINAEGHAVRRPQTLAELKALTGSDEPDAATSSALPRRWRFVSHPLR